MKTTKFFNATVLLANNASYAEKQEVLAKLKTLVNAKNYHVGDSMAGCVAIVHATAKGKVTKETAEIEAIISKALFTNRKGVSLANLLK